MQCESGQLRGGPNFTRGHCLQACHINVVLEDLVRSSVFQPTDEALLGSVLDDEHSPHFFTTTYYQKTQVASQFQDKALNHHLRRYQWYEKKRLLEHYSEDFPKLIRLGQISSLSPQTLARLLGVSTEQVIAMHISDAIAVEAHHKRGLKFQRDVGS